MNILELSEQEIGRRQSLQELRDMGIDPYPAEEFVVNATSEDIKANFKEDEQREITIAGRLMGKRIMGKASFAELQDGKGRVQLYISRDDLCPTEDKDLYNKVFKKLSILVISLALKALFSKRRWAKYPFMCRISRCFLNHLSLSQL